MAGWSQDFTAEKPQQRMLVGEPIVLWRKSDGSLVAMEDRCVHRLAPLSIGAVEGDSIRCLYHGLKFAAEGQCIEIPGQDIIPSNACVRTFPVVEKGQWVWVWMGDRTRADPARVPPVMALDDPEWIFRTGMIDYQCHYELINDNLLDLCHLTYVHAESFGADDAWSTTRPKLEMLPEGVRSSRWTVDTLPIPPLGKAAGRDRVDIWTTYDFVIPGVFLLYTAIYDLGTAEKSGYQAPTSDEDALFSNFTSQAVVATSETTSRYYYAWGPPKRHGGEADADIMIKVAAQAFQEDRVVIEAQQKIIDLDLSRRPVPTTADKAITLFTRLMRSQDQELA
jgi:vanillate O-demethylase monooxygenase subunit